MTFRLATLDGSAALVDAADGLHPLDTDALLALVDEAALHARLSLIHI